MAHPVAERYSSMQDLAGDIRSFLEIRPVTARPSSVGVRLQKWAKRNAGAVAFACAIVALITIGTSVALRFRSEKNQARQLTAIREAQLAARSGQWRKVIEHLRRAGEAGYRDQIHLGLERLQAWRALAEFELAQSELRALTNRTDLGSYRSTILL